MGRTEGVGTPAQLLPQPFSPTRIHEFQTLFGPMMVDVRRDHQIESDTGTVLETRSVSGTMESQERFENSLLIQPSQNGDTEDGTNDLRLHNRPSFKKETVIEIEEKEREVHRKFDVNMYASKKSAANGLLDIALLMANASQLKHILLTQGAHEFYLLVLSLLGASLVLQVIVGLMMLTLARMRISEDADDENDRRRTRRADILNNWVVGAVFLLTVINVFIASFGLNQAPAQTSPTGLAG